MRIKKFNKLQYCYKSNLLFLFRLSDSFNALNKKNNYSFHYWLDIFNTHILIIFNNEFQALNNIQDNFNMCVL